MAERVLKPVNLRQQGEQAIMIAMTVIGPADSEINDAPNIKFIVPPPPADLIVDDKKDDTVKINELRDKAKDYADLFESNAKKIEARCKILWLLIQVISYSAGASSCVSLIVGSKSSIIFVAAATTLVGLMFTSLQLLHVVDPMVIDISVRTELQYKFYENSIIELSKTSNDIENFKSVIDAMELLKKSDECLSANVKSGFKRTRPATTIV
jgi:hypothetical protein